MAQNDLSKTRTQSINIFCGQTDVLSGLPGSSVDQGGGSSKRTPAGVALAAAGKPGQPLSGDRRENQRGDANQ